MIAVLAGQPQDEGYADSCHKVFDLLAWEGAASKFSTKEQLHRRGSYPALNVGVTYGKGTPVPFYINGGKHEPMLQRLLSDAHVKRMACFASSGLHLNSFGGFVKLILLKQLHLNYGRPSCFVIMSNSWACFGSTCHNSRAYFRRAYSLVHASTSAPR